VSKLNLKKSTTDPQSSDRSGEHGQLLALSDKSKADGKQLREQTARAESDYQQLEKSRNDYKARVEALEMELTQLREAKYDAELQTQWLEMELESIESSTIFQATRSVQLLLRRIRKQRRLLTRFSYALFQFGPTEAMRRTKAYLDNRKIFGQPRVSAAVQVNDTVRVNRTSSAAVSPLASSENDQTPWAMYVSDFYDGGLEKVVLDLAVELSARGKSCSIMVKETSGRAGYAAREMGLNVVDFNGEAAAIRQFVLDNHITRVITHHCYDFLADIASTGAIIDEVIHNAYHWQRGNQTLSRVRDQFIETCISVSEFVNSYAISELKINPAKLRVIHNGLSRKGLIRPPVALMKQRRQNTLSNPVFVMLANVHLQKNHLAVLYAIKALKVDFPGVKLYMCGVIDVTTDMGKAIRLTAEKLQLSDTVEFTGPLAREGVSRLLSQSHVALLPTTVEGFSIASLEYCYFGLPMILSNTGASTTLKRVYASVVLAKNVALPASQLDSTKIERCALHPDKRCIAGIVTAMGSTLANYQYYLDEAEAAANDWKSYAIEATADRYLLLESEQWLTV
jgi:glycosyltransferase involved in cell wall biosynthesis